MPAKKLQQEEFSRFDIRLQRKAADIIKALSSIDYKFLFVMVHTGKRGAAENILADMQAWQKELNEAAIVTNLQTPTRDLPFQVHLASAEDLMEWMRYQASDTVDLDDVEITQYGRIESPYSAYYGMVGGDQIAEWWENYGSQLFSKNIRNLLGPTEVNDSIKITAEKSPHSFWYFNNGITILVKQINPHRRNNIKERDRGLFNFKDVSIINGAQTVSTIGRLAKNHASDTLSDIKVQTRFISVNGSSDHKKDDVGKQITKFNNLQNRVLGRDFASQEPNQLRLRDELIIEGYNYQLLRSDGSQQPDKKTIDIDEALDALACLNKTPTIVTTLKSKRGRFFENLEGSLYKTVFNPNISGVLLINAVTHHRVISKIIASEYDCTDKQNRRRIGVLVHANRVFSSVLLNRVHGLRRSDRLIEPNENEIKESFVTILNKTENHLREKHVNAYPARFFSNVDKVTELYDIIG
ncbi:MAG: AIPR family protein [Candidatus Electrothrix scaldis]|nr:MAG: AIPR family protein [Candidatus Electrothrix sp. GW3-3]